MLERAKSGAGFLLRKGERDRRFESRLFPDRNDAWRRTLFTKERRKTALRRVAAPPAKK